MKKEWIVPLLVLGATLMVPAEPPKVFNLKPLLDCKVLILDITFHAQDAYEDRDYSAGLEMTATARYELTQVDRSSASGRWETHQCLSHNARYRAFRNNKTYAGDNTEYLSRSGVMSAALAWLEVGGSTPGYSLQVMGAFPAQLKRADSGVVDSPLVLTTQVVGAPGLTGMFTGPLPESGTTLSGSKVIPFDIPPFLTGTVPGQTRMSIQFVVQPDPRLAPLTPR